MRYVTTGCPSIPPEPLRSARRLHVFYGVWREWQLMAPLDPNLLSAGSSDVCRTRGVGPDGFYQESRAGAGR